MYSSEFLRLNCQIFKLFFETSKYNGMKNLTIQNRVLQRRVLERYYCTQIIRFLIEKTCKSGKCRPPNSLCNKRHELAKNFLSLILINLVPKVASNCE